MEVDARIDSSLGDRDCAFLRKLGILYDANQFTNFASRHATIQVGIGIFVLSTTIFPFDFYPIDGISERVTISDDGHYRNCRRTTCRSFARCASLVDGHCAKAFLLRRCVHRDVYSQLVYIHIAFIAQAIFTALASHAPTAGIAVGCITLSIGIGGFAWAGFSVNHLDLAPQVSARYILYFSIQVLLCW